MDKKNLDGKKIHIMLVEDNPGDVLIINEMLKEIYELDFELIHFNRVDKGVEHIKENFDIMLLDLNLPDSQGIKTFKTMNTHAPELPIIILTGLINEDIAMNIVSEGAQDYLVKGQIDKQLLSRSIKYSIERKKIEIDLRKSEQKYRTLFNEDPDYNLLLGIDGTIKDINKATINLIGLSKKELVGKNYSQLEITPTDDDEFHFDNINRLLKGENIEPFESRFIDKNGDIHWIMIHLTAVKNESDSYILAIGSDVTERKIAENEIKSALDEKNILIQEIHHRVKNNMQIISSLLNLQTQYVDEQEAVDVLMESQNRVKSMAMIHEKLYMSEDLTHINFVDYIQSLVSNLFYSYNIKKNNIKPILELDNVSLNMETAVPCGLIISELVSNSLKYAFPKGMKGEILISLKTIKDKYELIISDNGIGLPEDIEFNKIETLGLLLVNNLTEQIDRKINIIKIPRTEFKIIFKELKYKNRI